MEDSQNQLQAIDGGTDEVLLSADDILKADDIKYEIVSVPEWGNGRTDKVRIKALSASERDEFESAMIKGTGKNQHVTTEDIRANLVARSIVDAKGERVFQAKHIKALGRKSAAAMDRVYEAAARLSKISQKDVEELEGNSEGDPSDDS